MPTVEIANGLTMSLSFAKSEGFKGEAIRIRIPAIEDGTWKFKGKKAEEFFLEQMSKVCYHYTNLGKISKAKVVELLTEVARRHSEAGNIVRA